MSVVRAGIAISLDGYVAGPNQTDEEPLGEGGERLHEWAFETEAFQRMHGREGGERNADSRAFDVAEEGIGAYVMGRKMFGPSGEWDPEWTGWWGDEPPFGGPVFVLTHHEREPLELGATTFTFVPDGIESALEQAKAAAGGQGVAIAGGGSAIRQYLAAGLLDELFLHIAPVVLGGGVALFEGTGDPKLEPAEVLAGEGATHIRYRVVR
jgi:dihydrofolate reductase